MNLKLEMKNLIFTQKFKKSIFNYNIECIYIINSFEQEIKFFL